MESFDLCFGSSPFLDNPSLFHPPHPQLCVLIAAYEENCDPLLKITHRPTIRDLFSQAARDQESLSKANAALLFSIYHIAAASTTPDQCRRQLGRPQASVTAHFRAATERALRRAYLLQAPSLTVLQAFLLYLIALRSQHDARLVWSLHGLASSLAHSIALHRDGTNLKLRPFETEMRRRLWWQLYLLGSRAAEDEGVEPSFSAAYYDVRLPLNINDNDISMETKEPPREREGTTEMTFCLIRFELSREKCKMNMMRYERGRGEDRPVFQTFAEAKAYLDGVRNRIEQSYLNYCDLTIPYDVLTLHSLRLLTCLGLTGCHSLLED